MAKPVVRNMFSRLSAPHPVSESRTSRVKQEFATEVDINSIVAKMKKGISPPPWMTSKTPRYGDFSQMPESLSEAYDIVRRAEEAFQALPVEFRREIDHDPARLATAPKELYERFGLLKKPAPGESRSDPEGAGTQRVQGDRDLPGKAPTGANKGNPKDSSKDSSES